MYAYALLLLAAIGPEEFNAAAPPHRTAQVAAPAPRYRYTVEELIANSRRNDRPQQQNNSGGGRRRIFRR